jgi:hypothetical protein
MKPVIRINRDTLITALLVVAGIVMALALFGAGVLWKSKSLPTKFTSSIPTQLPRLDMVQNSLCAARPWAIGAINTRMGGPYGG